MVKALFAEWSAYRGYLGRRNGLVGKRARGGYECELDVAAVHRGERRLLHFEPSLDADSWAKRDERFTEKLDVERRYIPGRFTGLDMPPPVEQLADCDI